MLFLVAESNEKIVEHEDEELSESENQLLDEDDYE